MDVAPLYVQTPHGVSLKGPLGESRSRALRARGGGGSASRKCSLKEAGDGAGDSLGGGLKEEELGEGQGREDILGRSKTSVHCAQRAWHSGKSNG